MKWFRNIWHKKSPINNSGIFYSTITQIISYKPRNIVYFETAFTHRSLNKLNENKQPINYERLEFLGDAILGSVIAAYLYKNAPKGDEGYLTQMRSKLVSRSHLNSIGKKLQLTNWVQTKAAISQFGDNINGNLLEALIGAIYMDKGFTACEKFIYKNILIEIKDLDYLENKIASYKSLFIEYCQKHKKTFKFDTQDDNGKDNIKHFYVKLYFNESVIARARATSKKKAEEKAAQRAFFALQSQMQSHIKK
ncbi:ribonuclease III [Flavobacterium sp. xlx-214]|uniref:ribonuclease III n=1 Tax=unclassified Flavobacterium TaxID=196869 RepID=UPI0013D1A052|nr:MULTISPECIES: ribonuclease III [unclassified Flavobacterium]MBA5793068.1 ribonuclease III [Flavobacterium sp. xlx-221]QMI84604.1 ribonuclease III [Flavobacterium sp. xlx-214]